MDASNFTPHESLLEPPGHRAAYSDRTAWLMAVMSQLAYLPFEGAPDKDELLAIAKSIAEKRDVATVVTSLERLVSAARSGGDGEAKLTTSLGVLRMELLDTFSVIVPLSSDSQAFIARVGADHRDDGKNDFIVVAFRGTEPTKMSDIRTDLRAALMDAPGLKDSRARVHTGFYKALNDDPIDGDSIIKRISHVLQQDEHKTLPVFVTGHSLGGALAVVATRYIANGSRGACYTFGQPRVSNQHFNDQIFTPLYRVVNAADIVPAVPMGEVFMNLLVDLVQLLPFPGKKLLVNLLKKIEGYRHGGDQRFLSPSRTNPNAGTADRYEDLKVYSNPSLFDRWVRSGHRIIGSWGGTFLADHDIQIYVEKLACYALRRQQDKHELNKGMKAHLEARASKPAAPAPKPKPATRSRAGAKPKTSTRATRKPAAKPKGETDPS